MQIGELAELAGVTVRTIRYYHQVGVLPEPPRRFNKYRDYTVDHLVALLRIRQLTESGLSLAQAGAVVVDSAPNSVEETLDDVERALDAQIAALIDRRRRLAQAQSGRHIGLSRLAAALTVRPIDMPIAILLAHLYADEPQAELLADVLLDPKLRSALESIQDRFDAVDETFSSTEFEELADQTRWILAELSSHLPPIAEDKYDLILTLAERDLNDQQKEFMRRLANEAD